MVTSTIILFLIITKGHLSSAVIENARTRHTEIIYPYLAAPPSTGGAILLPEQVIQPMISTIISGNQGQTHRNSGGGIAAVQQVTVNIVALMTSKVGQVKRHTVFMLTRCLKMGQQVISDLNQVLRL
ncbi:hypothetical protein ES705_40928 [subsurface metagenome]